MAKIVYKIVKHEDGWASQAHGTFSETFPSHNAALAAARMAAGEQEAPGETVGIQYRERRWGMARRGRSGHRPAADGGRRRQIACRAWLGLLAVRSARYALEVASEETRAVAPWS